MICKGDKTQFCGQGGKLSLWSFNGIVPTNTPPTTTAGGGGSGTSSTPSPIPSASGIAYLGCWSDTTNPRALSADFNNDEVRNSIDFCAQRAQTLNYRFFGLEYGAQCLLGDVRDKASTQLPGSSCAEPCKGNRGQSCGGTGR